MHAWSNNLQRHIVIQVAKELSSKKMTLTWRASLRKIFAKMILLVMQNIL
jgi:hypothetical protein